MGHTNCKTFLLQVVTILASCSLAEYSVAKVTMYGDKYGHHYHYTVRGDHSTAYQSVTSGTRHWKRLIDNQRQAWAKATHNSRKAANNTPAPFSAPTTTTSTTPSTAPDTTTIGEVEKDTTMVPDIDIRLGTLDLLRTDQTTTSSSKGKEPVTTESEYDDEQHKKLEDDNIEGDNVINTGQGNPIDCKIEKNSKNIGRHAQNNKTNPIESEKQRSEDENMDKVKDSILKKVIFAPIVYPRQKLWKYIWTPYRILKYFL